MRRDGRPVHEEQVANARHDFPDLRPADPSLYDVQAAHYQALIPGQEIPLIGEQTHGDEQDDR